MTVLEYFRVAVLLISFGQIGQIHGGLWDKYLDAFPNLFIPFASPFYSVQLSNIMNAAVPRIKNTPAKDWFSTSIGEPCRGDISDYLSNAPLNSSAFSVIPLCTLIGALRDVGKVRVPFFTVSERGNFINAPIGLEDVEKALNDTVTFDLSTLLGGLGEKCDQANSDLSTPTSTVKFTSLCAMFGLDCGLNTKFLVFFA